MEAGRSDSGGTMAWWYVCTLCNRATPHEAESRAHKLSEHKLVRTANILTLSEADLSPSVRVVTQSCGLLVKRTVKQEGDLQQPPDDPQTPASTVGDPDSDSAPEWKCKLCPTRFPTQTHLKGHVLLHHAPAAAPLAPGYEKQPSNVNQEVKQEATTNNFTPATPDTFSSRLRSTVPRRSARAALNLDEVSDSDCADHDSDSDGDQPGNESASDWTDEEAEERNGKRREGKGRSSSEIKSAPNFQIAIYKVEPIQRPNSDGRYECTICNKTYAPRTWKDHRRIHRKSAVASRTCPICKQVFSQANYLRHHQQSVHQGNRDYLCSTCGKGFKTAAVLKGHSLLHDPANKIHKCDQCGKSCFTSDALIKHKYKHAARTHLCPECGKLFKSALAVRIHQKAVHLNLLTVKCDKCGERFKSHLARNHHMAKHLDTKTLKCSQCPKMYKTKLQLYSHEFKVHRKTKKRFNCQFCQKEFPGEASLGSHELEVHDHERIPGNRFECKHCDRKFMWEFNLRSHEKLHSDERSYGCPEPGCGKTFKLGTHLYQHKFSHMPYEELPLVCEFEGCGKRFGVIGQLRSHKQRSHGVYDKPKRRAANPRDEANPPERERGSQL